jgi:hypothetical protein
VERALSEIAVSMASKYGRAKAGLILHDANVAACAGTICDILENRIGEG